jgi:hypothetical protein
VCLYDTYLDDRKTNDGASCGLFTRHGPTHDDASKTADLKKKHFLRPLIFFQN